MSLVRIPVGTSGLGMGTGANIQRAFNLVFFSLLASSCADFSCLVIAYDNGRSALLGEYSCMDGTPTL